MPELKEYAKGYQLVPVYKTIKAGEKQPVNLLRKLKNYSHKLFMLEHTNHDAAGNVVWDRYSYLGFSPALAVSCIERKVTIATAQASFSFETDAPAAFLRDIVSQNTAPKLPGLPPFFGGFAGYFSYEYIHLNEPTCHFCTENREGYRDFDLMLFDKLYVFDREDQVIYLICTIAADHLEQNYHEAEYTLSEMERILSEPSENTVKPLRLLSGLSPIYQKDAYMQMVEKAKHYIRKGDVAQIVLTNGKKAQAEGSLIDTFDYLRKTDPTRYMCFLSSDDMEAAMASPEPIARLHNGTVMTERLAGSYPRGKTPQEHRAQAEALRTDAKAIDEHNMLVDDSRNEFGYVSKIGTVDVKGYLNVVRCSRVMHLGSTITGELKEGMNALDVINTITPSGAVSGAPKIRSCEVINEIEQERRGIYGSAVGYIGLDGDADFFVFIHSAFLKNGELTVRAGGGIVIDSVPEEEYKECLFKAEAMLNAIQLASEEKQNDSLN